MYDVPILFIIFRRKDAALQAFERIRQIQPSQLYIAGDGARAGVAGEAEAVEQTRQAIVSSVDWPCSVHTLFQPSNLGCMHGVSTAISWLFENEEYGIILEDDCVADASFFPFVAELLQRYKDDQRIGMIAGTNQVDTYPMKYSYCFSRYAACWGWATWRRAWQHMRLQLDFLAHHQQDVFLNRGYLGKETGRWQFQVDTIRKNHVSAWDWQWYFSLASQNQLCIFPQCNLISNIGNDTGATHTSYAGIYMQSHQLAFPLTHPAYVLPDYGFDKRFYRADNTFSSVMKRLCPYRLKQFLKRHLH